MTDNSTHQKKNLKLIWAAANDPISDFLKLSFHSGIKKMIKCGTVQNELRFCGKETFKQILQKRLVIGTGEGLP